MSRREFCFWIIPAGATSQVKKVRVSIWKLLTLFTISTGLLSVLIFIAVDYVRIHGLNLKNYALWRNTASQRNSLIGEKEDLRAKLSSFIAANSARSALDSELEVKLEELSRFISESKAVQPADKQIEFKKGSKLAELEKAIGGLEQGCGSDGCSLLEQDLIAEDGQNSEGIDSRATYNPKRLFGNDLAADNERAKGQLEKLSESISILRAIPLLVPVQGDLTSGFGFRWSPFEHGIAKHEGIDFAATEGTAVGSAGDGQVVDVKRTSTYGLVVDISHTSRIATRYAHLSSALVVPGDKVLRGDLIGQVGSSGRSTGPHLHYEVIVDGRQINPKNYLALSERLSKLMIN